MFKIYVKRIGHVYRATIKCDGVVHEALECKDKRALRRLVRRCGYRL